MNSEQIIVIPIKAVLNTMQPMKTWKFHKKMDWEFVCIPGDMTHNDFWWRVFNAETWFNTVDKTMFTKVKGDYEIEDSVSFRKKKKDGTEEIHGRNVNDLIGVALTRLYYQVVGAKPPEVESKSYQNCISSRSRCINYAFKEYDGKSTLESRETGPAEACMYCKAKRCLVDQDEVDWFNKQLSRDSGFMIDAYGRCKETSGGFSAPGVVSVYHNMDAEKILDEMAKEGQQEWDGIYKQGRTKLQTLKRSGISAYVEDAERAYHQYGATSCFPDLDDDERDKLYEKWLEDEVNKTIREQENKEAEARPWWEKAIDAPELEGQIPWDEEEVAPAEMTPFTIKDTAVADREVTMNMLRYHWAWTAAQDCPYWSNYSWGHYENDEKTGKKFWRNPHWWAQPANVAVVDESDYYAHLVAGDVEVIFDREVCMAYNGNTQLPVRFTLGVAKNILDSVQYDE